MFRLAQVRKWPWARLAKWFGGALLAGYVLYVVSVAAFLSFGGLAWATEGEEDAHVEVKSGYSLFPGRVHVRGLKLRVKDYNIEMDIRVDSADVSLALRKLPLKRLHVSWVAARGVEYRLVHRVVDPVASADRLAAFPEIPGFTRPLHYDAPKPAPTPGKPWSVRFDVIEAEVRLAWLLEYQVRGKLTARGGFFLDPSREAHVFPCRVEVAAAEVFVRDQRVASGVQGSLSAQVSPFDPREAETLNVIPKMSAGIERFSATLDTLDFTKLYVENERIAWEGRGQLELDLRMVRGQLRDGSTANLGLDPIVVRAGAVQARGKGSIALRAEPAGRLESEASFSFPEEEGAAFSAESVQLETAVDHEFITEVDLRRVRLGIDHVQFARPEFLHGLVGQSRAVPMSGGFDAHVLLDLPQQGTTSLDVEVAARSASFYLPGLRFGMTAQGVVNCRGTRSLMECELDAHAPSVRFDRQPSKEAATLWVRAKTKERLRVSVEKQTVSGRVHVVGSDPKPVVSELIGEDWIVQLGLGLVPTGPLDGTLDVNQDPAGLTLRGDVSSGSTRVHGYLHAREVTSGAWIVDMPTHRWGFELEPTGVTPYPLVGGDWLATH